MKILQINLRFTSEIVTLELIKLLENNGYKWEDDYFIYGKHFSLTIYKEVKLLIPWYSECKKDSISIPKNRKTLYKFLGLENPYNDFSIKKGNDEIGFTRNDYDRLVFYAKNNSGQVTMVLDNAQISNLITYLKKELKFKQK
jgi:hypothetical protein